MAKEPKKTKENIKREDKNDNSRLSFGISSGSKNRNWAMLTFPALILLFIVIRLVFDYQNFASEIGFLFSIIRFLIWGYAIFFVLQPFVSFLERKFAKLKGKWGKLFAMLIVYIVFLGILTAFFVWLLPMVINNLLEITKIIPEYADDIGGYIEKAEIWLSRLNIVGLEDKVQETLLGLVDTLTKSLGDISLYILGTSYGLLRGVLDFLIGIVISVYMLIEKESLKRRIKKLTYSVLKKDKADKASLIANKTGIIFRKFIIGKTIDSLIVGIVSYFVMLIIGAPVPMLLAVIIGVTNMIPTIGPIIGAIPCLLITVIISPLKAIWVLVYILIVQAVDGMILGPKILGDTVGLKPFYIIIAVLVGGGLFGIAGAFLGTPTLAVIKSLLQDYTKNKLKSKKIVIT